MSDHWLKDSYSEMNRQAKAEEEQAIDFKFRCIHCSGLFFEDDLTDGICDECAEIEEKHKND